MFRVFFIFFTIYVADYLQSVTAQDGAFCESPKGEDGICIDINKCTTLLNLLITQNNNPQVRALLRSSTCGFVEKTPLVCCPHTTNSRNVDPFISSTTSQYPDEISAETNDVTSLPRTPQCGVTGTSVTRVVNGVPARLGEFPWIVALGYKNSKKPEEPKWLCGGTLITNKHILTAGHCVHNRADLYLARLGDLDLFSNDDNATPENIPLRKAKVHEEYSPITFTNDIAILTLAYPPKIANVTPICLPIDEPLRSKNMVGLYPFVAGWGAIYFNGPSSSILREAIIPIVDNAKCKQAYGSTKSIIDERVLCAGYTSGKKDACQGDSGGPMMQRLNNNDFTQIGIVSYGFKCAEARYPGVYTRVTAFIDWIQKNLK